MGSKSNITWLSQSPIITPEGTAKYAYLQKPDQYGNYCVTLVLDDTPETTQFVEEMTRLQNEFLVSTGGQPEDRWKAVKQRPDKFDGQQYIQFKTPVKRRDGKDNSPINTYNSKNEVCDEPWSNDRIRVAFSLGGWTSPSIGSGAKAYTKCVQLVKKASSKEGGQDASPFSTVTGGYEGTSNSTSGTAPAPNLVDVPTVSSEDIPF